MMISDEQARRAARLLQTTERRDAGEGAGSPSVDEELLARLAEVIANVPDMRPDRIARAREMLASPPSSAEVAEKIIDRVLSDALR